MTTPKMMLLNHRSEIHGNVRFLSLHYQTRHFVYYASIFHYKGETITVN